MIENKEKNVTINCGVLFFIQKYTDKEGLYGTRGNYTQILYSWDDNAK